MDIMGPIFSDHGPQALSLSLKQRTFLPECLSGWGIGSHITNPARHIRSLQVFDRHVTKIEELVRSRSSSVPFWLRILIDDREARSTPPAAPLVSRREELAMEDIASVNDALGRQPSSIAAKLRLMRKAKLTSLQDPELSSPSLASRTNASIHGPAPPVLSRPSLAG